MKNSELIIFQISRTMLVLVLVLFGIKLQAQKRVSLHIGDNAPEIKYSKWLKGSPVNSFKGNKLYIMEFWATWCGPCIAAMPHLSELARKYGEKTVFIGVNVWEKVGNKPYDSSLPEVTRFVNGSGGRMAYNVIADNNAQYMFNEWLQAAGINGIPSTFIVQKGKIVWIGHPIKLDGVIDSLLAGTFNIDENKAKYEADRAIGEKEENAEASKFQPILDSYKAKDYTRALTLIDQQIPSLKIMLDPLKFRILLEMGREVEAIKLGVEIIKNEKSAGPGLGMTISELDGLSKQTYLFGIEGLSLLSSMPSVALDKIALLYSKAGDFKAAVITQQKAIDLAKVEMLDPKWAGIIFDYTIANYQRKLETYKKSIE